MKSSAHPLSDTSQSARAPLRIEGTWQFAILTSSYHPEITRRLASGARERLMAAGVASTQITDYSVPGAWELPLAASWAARSARFAAIIALGVVLQGETSHDQHINRFVSLSLGQLGIEHQLPIAFGLLTCATELQAEQRSGGVGSASNKGAEAADAALAMLELRRKFPT